MLEEFYSAKERRECKAYETAQEHEIANNCWAGPAIASYFLASCKGQEAKARKWLAGVIAMSKGDHKVLMIRLEQEACVVDVCQYGITRYRDINKPRAYMLLNEIQAYNAMKMGAFDAKKFDAVSDSGMIRAFRHQQDDNGMLDKWFEITDMVIASQMKMGCFP